MVVILVGIPLPSALAVLGIPGRDGGTGITKSLGDRGFVAVIVAATVTGFTSEGS